MYKALFATVLSSAALVGQTNTASVSANGSIQGTVTDTTTNQPISGAIVRAVGNGTPWSSQSAPTGADGFYQITNAPTGMFTLCAWVPYQPYVNPCFGGGGTPLVVSLASGQQSTGNQIALKQDQRLIGPPVAATGTGSIQGTVTDASTNTPIGGAIVTAVSTTTVGFSQSVPSAADGSYQIRGAPAGTFSLCVHVPGDRYLNPCHWGSTPLTLSLTSGQQSTGNQLHVTAGSTLKVRIQDPSQFMNQKTKDGNEPDLAMGVFGAQGLFYPAHQVGKDSAGADYQLAIPSGTQVMFSIASKTLTLADNTGVGLPNNAAQQTLQQSSGNPNPQQLTYTVTGHN